MTTAMPAAKVMISLHEIVRLRLNAYLLANKAEIAEALDDPCLFMDPEKFQAEELIPRIAGTSSRKTVARRRMRRVLTPPKSSQQASTESEAVPATVGEDVETSSTARSSACVSGCDASAVIEKNGRRYAYAQDQFGMKHLQCPMCLDVFVKPTVTECDHTFCADCISHWISRMPSCPVDRQRVDYWTLKPATRLVRNQIDDLTVVCLPRLTAKQSSVGSCTLGQICQQQ
eukprot:Opistho-2@15871